MDGKEGSQPYHNFAFRGLLPGKIEEEFLDC